MAIADLIAGSGPPNLLGNFAQGLQVGQQFGAARDERKKQSRINELVQTGDVSGLAKVDPTQAANLLKVRSGLAKEQKDEFDSGMRTLSAFTEGITDANDPRYAQQLQLAVDANVGIDIDDMNQALQLGPQVIQRLSKAGGRVDLAQVQSSKILPGGLTQITRKDGRTEIVRLNEKDTKAVMAAEERGVKLQGQRAEAREEGKLTAGIALKPEMEAAVIAARSAATERGEVFNELNEMQAALPSLESTVNSLRELAPIATSTLGGSVFDTVVKESGFGATTGATAKAKFIAIINNQVLPLLKPTFGAAFTVQEGESLKATMGDPDATPEAKMAQLDAFIAQKVRNIEAKQAQLQPQQSVQPQQQTQQTQQTQQAPQVMRFDAQGNLIQ